uniref:LRRCT domain-containing protein n=1 Tax=Panagrolaimus davidi TaxID=227884 RepID=A0A914PFY9_9BILA
MTKCKCHESILNCDSNGVQNLNIHVIEEDFTVKIANFKYNGIKVVRKKLILPGREYSVQSLDFQFNLISKIENAAFDEFRKLEKLNLSNNNLTKIDENILTESLGTTLLELNLNRNELQKINALTFVNLKKLEFLGLSDNAALMPFFNKNVFSKSLANLKKLDLSFCNISILEEDVFINLINLEYLILYKNPFTTIPKAIKYLVNLRILDVSHSELKILNNETFAFNDKFEDLVAIDSDNLISIGDCAFCNLPNLKRVELWVCPNLTNIHENAFGSISSGKLYSKLTDFGISGSNISSISEKLFDWSKADKLYLGTKGYICDCSMAWLINDLKRSDSIFSKKLKSLERPPKYRCEYPPELKGKKLSEVSGKICNGKLSELYHSNSSSSTTSIFSFHWIFLIGIIFGIGILCYIYHNQILAYFCQRNSFQNETDDENKLYQYFNPEADTISM